MLKSSLSAVAYVVVTIGVQAVSHFGVAASHYAAVSFLRPEPIAVLGIVASAIQGAALTYLFQRTRLPGTGILPALAFSWVAGAILVSYIALVEPAKYAVPSVAAWIAVELGFGFVQFTLFGLLLALIHRRATSASAAPATP
jgi:hypothetical protein